MMFKFTFATPAFFLLLLPWLAAAWAVYRAQKRQAALLFAAGSRLPARPATWRTRLLPVIPALFLAGLFLGIVALARPQKYLARVIHHTDAIAIQMVVDCSGSMEALDFSTRDEIKTRLDVVKETFAGFIGGRPDDLIGLITFGGYATSRAPLTIDHAALLHILKGVEVPRNIFDKGGQIMNREEMLTAIGDALATGCNRLGTATNVKSRIMVLLSDGESNTGVVKPDEAAGVAKALKIKVYTIGVGTTGIAPFMARDMFGRQVIQRAEVRLDEDLLRRIADTTGGQYFNVKDPKGLARALADIDRLEKTRIDKSEYTQFNELFAMFLVPGLLLLAGAGSLNLWIRRTIV